MLCYAYPGYGTPTTPLPRLLPCPGINKPVSTTQKKPPRRHGDVFGNANEWDDVTVVFDLKVFGIIPLSYQTHLNEQI